MEYKFSNAVVINPKESLKKGTNAKKIAMADIQENYRFIKNFELDKFKSGTKFRNGDTLFARITPCLENGKIAQVNILEENEVAFGSTEFLVLRGREGVAIPDYVYYLSKWDYIKDNAIKSMTGTSGRQRVQNSIFDELVVDIPTIERQKSIVSVLNNLDYRIEINNKIIENLEAQAQAIFKSWFVDFEPFQDGDFEESELGLIPEGWDVNQVGKITSCKLGGTPSRKKEEFWGGEIPWINSGAVNKERILQGAEYITEEGLNSSSTKLLPKKTTLVAITGATLGQVSLLEIDCCTNQSVIGILENEEMPYEFIYLFIKENIKKIILNQTGAAQQHINLNDIRTTKILIPDSSAMGLFKGLMSPIFMQIENLYFQNQTLAQTRDTLLPKLMSGEIDISNIKIDDEDIDYE
ncbi:MAG: restriction endonuclease subunit S [Anaerococcus sp.]|uniref:restriction endonuclease subunit S n=1 Tax=Anaerococcus sp. TaxID=1872515 RepID=UPI0029023184|nr:restriction endonuclease subunit S [Anaerococcus sp.]MDU2353008.1 restriction endonuclease subunit S [Anaerococcus sp.]